MPTRNECMGWFAQIGCRLQYCTSPWATYCYKENLPVFAHPQMLQLISYWGLGKLGHTCGDWAGWNRLGNYRKWHVGRAIYTNCRLTAHGLFSGDSKWKCSWVSLLPMLVCWEVMQGRIHSFVAEKAMKPRMRAIESIPSPRCIHETKPNHKCVTSPSSTSIFLRSVQVGLSEPSLFNHCTWLIHCSCCSSHNGRQRVPGIGRHVLRVHTRSCSSSMVDDRRELW